MCFRIQRRRALFLLYTLKMEREREESWLGEKVGDGMGEWEEREQFKEEKTDGQLKA